VRPRPSISMMVLPISWSMSFCPFQRVRFHRLGVCVEAVLREAVAAQSRRRRSHIHR
jgi:hypothetical protein